MLSRLKIGPRLAVAFGFMLLASILIGALSLLRLAALNNDLQLIKDDRVSKVVKLSDIMLSVAKISREMRDAVLADSDRRKQEKLATKSPAPRWSNPPALIK